MRTSNSASPNAIEHPSVWTAADFQSDSSWLHRIQRDQADCILNAARLWQGRSFSSLSREEAEAALAALVPLARTIRRELGTRGFALIRGMPVGELSSNEIRNIYWGIGLLFGQGLTQNARADFLCPVTDMGVNFGYSGSAEQQNARGYQSNADLNYHCDPTDVVALLCVRKAREGGVSTIVSTPAVYNEIALHHPEHLEVLKHGFPYDRKAEQWPSEAPVTERIPVFREHSGRVTCRYARSYILGGAQKTEPLTAAELAALDCFDEIARRPGMSLHVPFEPGDIQLLNNFTVVHGRTAYTDDPEPTQRRFLWRLWLQLGDEAPWNQESEEMRWAFARFGNLGRTVKEWERIEALKA